MAADNYWPTFPTAESDNDAFRFVIAESPAGAGGFVLPSNPPDFLLAPGSWDHIPQPFLDLISSGWDQPAGPPATPPNFSELVPDVSGWLTVSTPNLPDPDPQQPFQEFLDLHEGFLSGLLTGPTPDFPDPPDPQQLFQEFLDLYEELWTFQLPADNPLNPWGISSTGMPYDAGGFL